MDSRIWWICQSKKTKVWKRKRLLRKLWLWLFGRNHKAFLLQHAIISYHQFHIQGPKHEGKKRFGQIWPERIWRWAEWPFQIWSTLRAGLVQEKWMPLVGVFPCLPRSQHLRHNLLDWNGPVCRCQWHRCTSTYISEVLEHPFIEKIVQIGWIPWGKRSIWLTQSWEKLCQ
jgi:hypothetical protein